MSDKPIEWVPISKEDESTFVAFGTDMHDWDHVLEAALTGARLILAQSKEQGSPEIGECISRAVNELLELRNSYAMQLNQPVDPKKLN